MKRIFNMLGTALGIGLIVAAVFVGSDTLRWILLVAGVVVVLFSLVESLMLDRRRRSSDLDGNALSDISEGPEPPRYARRKSFVSRAEYSLMLKLKEIKPEKYDVIPQPALITVIDKLTQNAYRNELFRVCDFLFVDKNSYEPLLLVELNDSSHFKAERQERDRKVTAICESARMPLVSFTMQEANDFKYVRKMVLKKILK